MMMMEAKDGARASSSIMLSSSSSSLAIPLEPTRVSDCARGRAHAARAARKRYRQFYVARDVFNVHEIVNVLTILALLDIEISNS
jgi:hypothetical protein